MGCGGEVVADADSKGLAIALRTGFRSLQQAEGAAEGRQSGGGGAAAWRAWETEPDVGRVAHGIPNRVDRLRALGNAVVPQIPDLIGRAIIAYERQLAVAA